MPRIKFFNAETQSWEYADAQIGTSSPIGVDETLKISGRAADAKVTGDAIRALEEIVSNLSDDDVSEEEIVSSLEAYFEKNPIDTITEEELAQNINEAIGELIDSGTLNGKDGYTPVKGIDYFDGKDGYTPVKGVDYFDGVDGKDYILTEDDKHEIAGMVDTSEVAVPDEQIQEAIESYLNENPLTIENKEEVYIGSDEPTDPDIKIWVNNEENDDSSNASNLEVITLEEIDAICGMTIISSDDYIDKTTGISYRLYVDEGKLHMTEVE